MELITIKRHHAMHESMHDSEKHAHCDDDIYHCSPDTEYMKMCHEVDMNPPETWQKYDAETPAGMKKIIEMEYKELMSATSAKETEENIYHLSVALLRMWRLHHNE